MKTKILSLALVAASLCFAACVYDSPLTTKATRKIDERLLGDWDNKQSPDKGSIHVRKLDDTTYVVATPERLLARAYHSDFEGVPFISIQSLEDKRLYFYVAYELSPEGDTLTLRSVRKEVVSDKIKGQAALQEAVRKNLTNPALWGEFATYTRAGRSR